MDTFRFIHTSDLHLGKRFGSFDEDVRARLIEARHGAIERLAGAARSSGAAHVFVAGDVFDTEFVSARVRGQALAAMAAAPDLTWWLLPGNHDSLAAEPLWESLRRDAPGNIRLLDNAAPVAVTPEVQLLPAPVSHRFTGLDATAWMTGCATPEGTLRIGLAHGGVTSFGSDDDASEVIPPDRDRSAGLDYLALGDWHGTMRVTPRCWYSGTPERDGFRHDGRGVCLAVALMPGAAPQIEQVRTGAFEWLNAGLALTPEMDVAAALDGALPGAGVGRRDMLVRLTLSGRVRLPERGRLDAALREAAPLFWHLERNEADLATETSAGDLDEIAESGALRLAAEALHGNASDPTASEHDRRVAAAALDRLFALITEGRS